MSKVEEIRAKYPSIANATFTKFLDGDTTPTKKYLEYLCKSWNNRQTNNAPVLSSSLLGLVLNFDSLLPYIENKDIYSPMYANIRTLKDVIIKAAEVREEKTFNRDEHAVVIDETEDYMFIRPLTHRGSLKYGASTRWCTAAKNDSSTFKRYVESGLLVYLISKKGDKINNTNKIAFYLGYNNDGLNGQISIYNSSDTEIRTETILKNGWDYSEIFKLISQYRLYFHNEKKVRTVKGSINSFVETLRRLDFDELRKSIEKLDESLNVDYISNIQSQLNEFYVKINKINNLCK